MVVTTVGAVGGGGGAATGDNLGVAACGARGVLASLSPVGMMKRPVGADGAFLSASGRGVSKPTAVGALSIVVTLRRFLELEPL